MIYEPKYITLDQIKDPRTVLELSARYKLSAGYLTQIAEAKKPNLRDLAFRVGLEAIVADYARAYEVAMKKDGEVAQLEVLEKALPTTIIRLVFPDYPCVCFVRRDNSIAGAVTIQWLRYSNHERSSFGDIYDVIPVGQVYDLTKLWQPKR